MTVKHLHRILPLAVAAIIALPLASCGGGKDDAAPEKPQSTKRERNAIKTGNELYGKQRYAEAEISYKKALEENPENTAAQFNLASSYLKQRGEDLANKGDSLVRTADAMMAKLGQAPQPEIAQSAFYDRGNIAYKAEDYSAAIEHYKNALRRDPSDDLARENLRLAQLKKQEQDQQNQDQDKDQNQQDQQNQDKDQQQQQQQQQDQQQQKDQDQQKDQQQQQNQQEQQQQQQQQQGGLSDANANQILKAMEDKENGTRRKVELMKQEQEKRSQRRTTNKPW
ncbi:MAG: tetratricopeptide repeat protein [Muribaculaceae bacterium]|nr:tetratricopeptide repeat protein [Muribaculaceae bacterium]